MKKVKKYFIAVIGAIIAGSCFYLFWLCPRYTVPILMYHSFENAPAKDNLVTISPDHFEQQMAFLRKNGYHVISLDELVNGLKYGRKFSHNTVVITIDDGYQNNYTYAYPILKKYGFPATIFLATNLMESKDMYLTWTEIKEMSQNNIYFGGHTKNHVYLPSIMDKDVLWDEIAGSKEMIEKHMGHSVGYFCYPTGGFTEEVKNLVKKAGYKGACTTNRGSDFLNRQEFYELNRVSVRNADYSLSFWAKLSGYYNLFRKLRPAS